jgi:hypothetical protein
VLMEAGTEADVTDWLDKNALLALWPQLYLPPLVRQAWERRHPQLARTGARPHREPGRRRLPHLGPRRAASAHDRT